MGKRIVVSEDIDFNIKDEMTDEYYWVEAILKQDYIEVGKEVQVMEETYTLEELDKLAKGLTAFVKEEKEKNNEN